MKITPNEITQTIEELGNALMYAKEARRIAKKDHGTNQEISANLKYAYVHLQKAAKILEMQGDQG